MAEQNDIDYYDETGLNSSKEKNRRNVWTEKKNAALVEIVKNSVYPTPWRPKHGTSKEVWTDITNQMHSRPDIFDRPVHWEAAKEHLLSIIERQKMRRSLGDFEVKTQTERYVDEMIKHMLAEDAEKAASLLRQKDRQPMAAGVSRRSLDAVVPDSDRKRKLEHLAPDSLLQLSGGSEGGEQGADEQSASILEREKLRLEYELQKEKIRSDRDKERDELLIQRDQEFIKFVQDQLAASQALFQTTNDLISKLLSKLDSQGK